MGWVLTMVRPWSWSPSASSASNSDTTGPAARSTITVTGSGTVQGTPDTINFQIGVSTVNPDGDGGVERERQQGPSLEAALLKNGVTRKGDADVRFEHL